MEHGHLHPIVHGGSYYPQGEVISQVSDKSNPISSQEAFPYTWIGSQSRWSGPSYQGSNVAKNLPNQAQ